MERGRRGKRVHGEEGDREENEEGKLGWREDGKSRKRREGREGRERREGDPLRVREMLDARMPATPHVRAPLAHANTRACMRANARRYLIYGQEPFEQVESTSDTGPPRRCG